MFDLNDAYSNVTIDEIFSKVSEYELWKYYCHNFDKVNKPFASELYKDNNPDCRIFRHSNNKLLYKDFGDNGKVYDIVQYVMAKYYLSYYEAINVIANDFNIRKSKLTIDKTIKEASIDERLVIRPKPKIDIISQPFNLIDYDYWSKYYIPFTLLDKYNVFSARHVHLIKEDRTIVFNYVKWNPIYAYRFVDSQTNDYSYKIYKPYEPDKRYKWLFSGTTANIEGYQQLPLYDNLLVLGKSLKDVMVYRLLGYSAISLQGEGNKVPKDLLESLKRRFNRIIVNYDNDEAGIAATNKICKEHNLDYFFIDEFKDISDYVKANGLEKGRKMIGEKTNE